MTIVIKFPTGGLPDQTANAIRRGSPPATPVIAKKLGYRIDVPQRSLPCRYAGWDHISSDLCESSEYKVELAPPSSESSSEPPQTDWRADSFILLCVSLGNARVSLPASGSGCLPRAYESKQLGKSGFHSLTKSSIEHPVNEFIKHQDRCHVYSAHMG
jgi:hypothetical protein